MKSFIAIAVVALSAGLCLGQATPSQTRIKDLIDAAVAYEGAVFKQNDPINLKDAKVWPIIAPGFNLTAKSTKRTVTGLGNINIVEQVIDEAKKTARMTFQWPHEVESSHFSAKGSIGGKVIDETGDLIVVTKDAKVTITVGFIEPSLFGKKFTQISHLGMDWDMHDVTVTIAGLSHNVTELEELCKQAVLHTDNDFKTERAAALSLAMQSSLNLAIAGKSVEDLTAWLKAHTAKTDAVPTFFTVFDLINPAAEFNY